MDTFTHKLLLFLLMVSLLHSTSIAQITNRTEGFVDANKGLPNSTITEIPYVPDSYDGTFYIADEWSEGSIEVKGDQAIIGYPLKYDLHMERMEIKVGEEEKMMELDMIKSFEWADSLTGKTRSFINGTDFHYVASYKTHGIFEVVEAGGKMQLLRKQEIKIKEGNYNLQIDIGDRTPKLVKVSSFYLQKDNLVFKLPNKKWKRYLFFGKESHAVEEYVKSNKLKFRREKDLKLIVRFFNGQ